PGIATIACPTCGQSIPVPPQSPAEPQPEPSPYELWKRTGGIFPEELYYKGVRSSRHRGLRTGHRVASVPAFLRFWTWPVAAQVVAVLVICGALFFAFGWFRTAAQETGLAARDAELEVLLSQKREQKRRDLAERERELLDLYTFRAGRPAG